MNNLVLIGKLLSKQSQEKVNNINIILSTSNNPKYNVTTITEEEYAEKIGLNENTYDDFVGDLVDETNQYIGASINLDLTNTLKKAGTGTVELNQEADYYCTVLFPGTDGNSTWPKELPPNTDFNFIIALVKKTKVLPEEEEALRQFDLIVKNNVPGFPTKVGPPGIHTGVQLGVQGNQSHDSHFIIQKMKVPNYKTLVEINPLLSYLYIYKYDDDPIGPDGRIDSTKNDVFDLSKVYKVKIEGKSLETILLDPPNNMIYPPRP